jgi:hypothetical protein
MIIKKTLRVVKKGKEWGAPVTQRFVHLVVGDNYFSVQEWVVENDEYEWCVGPIKDVKIHRFDTLTDAEQAFSRMRFAEKI